MQTNWYDTAQICRNGHVINSRMVAASESNRVFCQTCGERSISTCQHCNASIPGFYHRINVVGGPVYVAPKYCHSCGKPYPWTEAELQAIKELAEMSLDEQDAHTLAENLGDIAHDAPRTKVAVLKVKNLLVRSVPVAGGMLRDMVVDIASEAAKKALLGQ